MSEQIPERIKAAIDKHVTKGQTCGHFVTAVLENDLTQAINHADPDSLLSIHSIVGYCYNNIPSPCWGSPRKVKAWIRKGGDKEGLENAG